MQKSLLLDVFLNSPCVKYWWTYWFRYWPQGNRPISANNQRFWMIFVAKSLSVIYLEVLKQSRREKTDYWMFSWTRRASSIGAPVLTTGKSPYLSQYSMVLDDLCCWIIVKYLSKTFEAKTTPKGWLLFDFLNSTCVWNWCTKWLPILRKKITLCLTKKKCLFAQ